MLCCNECIVIIQIERERERERDTRRPNHLRCYQQTQSIIIRILITIIMNIRFLSARETKRREHNSAEHAMRHGSIIWHVRVYVCARV